MMNTTDANSTAWADINPMMALAPRADPPLPLSRTCSALAPATPQELVTELAACLTLCVPAGMVESARTEWFKVARLTVGHLPLDLLRIGCDHARAVADHPAKICPAIIAETRDLLEHRKRSAAEDRTRQSALPPPTKRDVMDRRGEPMSAADTAELNERLERLGAIARYREDGSRYIVEKAEVNQ
jgi:hypothetical protein